MTHPGPPSPSPYLLEYFQFTLTTQYIIQLRLYTLQIGYGRSVDPEVSGVCSVDSSPLYWLLWFLVIVCRPILYYTTQHYTTLHYTTLNYTTLHNTTLHYTTLNYTTRHNTTRHYTTLNCTARHNTAQHIFTNHPSFAPAQH